MAVLKDHLLREVITDVYAQGPKVGTRIITGLPIIERFILSGKVPFRVFCQIIMDEVTITFISPGIVRMTYRDDQWMLRSVFLNILFINWARKLKMEAFEWMYGSLRSGYSRILAENSDVTELSVDNNRFNDWATILKAFPNLVFLRTSARNFSSMLFCSSALLVFLKGISLKNDQSFVDAHEALAKHQSKFPRLETVQYTDASLGQIRFPKNASVLSIKHLIIETDVKCCTPWNFSFLKAAENMFPSLKSVEIVATKTIFSCPYSLHDDDDSKLKSFEEFYRAFDALNFGFDVEIYYEESIFAREPVLNKLRQFCATKGKIYGDSQKFTVVTTAPRKRLTFSVESEFKF
uniref:F-box domain-containing protein n=1 Tax=Panagrellus redivivus TaxID=6233 RepID=A0A7E4V8P6_PANRE